MTRRTTDQSGSIAAVQATALLVVALMIVAVAIDVAVLLHAGRTATTSADAAALAAVNATVPPRTSPRAAADAIARANDTALTRCDCGSDTATVEVRKALDTWLLHLVGMRAVYATSTARLVPDTTDP